MFELIVIGIQTIALILCMFVITIAWDVHKFLRKENERLKEKLNANQKN